MKKHQSSYEDILFIPLHSHRVSPVQFTRPFAYYRSRPFISHTENGVSSHTPYIVTYRPTPSDVGTHHMIVCYVHPQ